MRPASKTELRIGVCIGVVLLPRELSSDILFLIFEAAAPGTANSPSYAGFGRGVLEARCERVDFLSEVVLRTGVFAPLLTGEEKLKVLSVYKRDDSSEESRRAGD